MMLRRLLLLLPLTAALAGAPAASAESTATAVRKAYKSVLTAVDAIYNARDATALGAAAAQLDRACARGLKRVSRTRPRSTAQRRARRRALKGLRECRRAVDLFAQAARLPDGPRQNDVRRAGENALKAATDDLDAANRALMR